MDVSHAGVGHARAREGNDAERAAAAARAAAGVAAAAAAAQQGQGVVEVPLAWLVRWLANRNGGHSAAAAEAAGVAVLDAFAVEQRADEVIEEILDGRTARGHHTPRSAADKRRARAARGPRVHNGANAWVEPANKRDG